MKELMIILLVYVFGIICGQGMAYENAQKVSYNECKLIMKMEGEK